MNGSQQPASPAGGQSTGADDAAAFRQECKRIFLKWEKLRLVYNPILAATFLAASFRSLEMLTQVPTLVTLIWAAVGANICFLAGPAVEAYLAWLGVRWRPMTAILFVSGTIFAAVLTLLAAVALLPIGFFPFPAQP